MTTTTLLNPAFAPATVAVGFPAQAPGYERTEAEKSAAVLAAIREAQAPFERKRAAAREVYVPELQDYGAGLSGRFTAWWLDEVTPRVHAAQDWLDRHPIAKAAADAALITLAFVAVWGCVAGLMGLTDQNIGGR